MALDMFLELAGIAGESTDPVHKGEIQISSWSWGLSEPASAASAGSGAGAGKVAIQNIVIQKNVDIASPLLIQHCAQATLRAGRPYRLGDRERPQGRRHGRRRRQRLPAIQDDERARDVGYCGCGGGKRSTDRNCNPCF